MTDVKIIITTKTVKAGELMPGDLFSTIDGKHWSTVNLTGEAGIDPVGEKVYIRTNVPILEKEKDADVTLVDLSYERTDGNRFQSKSHQAYHIDVTWDEEGNRIAELAPNPNCPYCQGRVEQKTDRDEGEATDATINRG